MSKSFSRMLLPATLVLIILQGCLDDLSFEFPKKQINNCESSCFIFQGIVFDLNNSEPLSATIDIIYSPSGYPSIPIYYGEIETNTKGFFSVNLNAKNFKHDNGDFIFTAFRDGYLTNDIDGRTVIYGMDSTKYNMPVIADIDLRPSATLNFNFTISEPNQLQSLTYSYKYAQRKYQHAPLKQNYGLDTLYTHPVAGDQFVYTWITYKENNQDHTIQDSIYLKKGETKLVETFIN